MLSQPDPSIFYKCSLDFNISNMCSILSFDSRSMSYLLDDQFDDYFSHDYPIFFKNKISKGRIGEENYFFRNAIDNALRNNQVRACIIIIDYIIKY